VKIFILCVISVELLRPVALEVDSIDEDKASQAVYSIWCNELCDLVVGLLCNPLINDLCRSLAVTPGTNKTIFYS